MIAPAFHEEWFSAPSCQTLAGLARSVADIDGRIIEVGSWEGRSTITLANAIRPRPVHAVDTWEGSPAEISADIAATRDVFAQFRANVEQFTRGNVVIHRMGWRDYVRQSSGPVALLFIDAEHTYREVYDNIEAFLPLMSPGGVICGDDAHHPPVLTAAMEWFPDLHRQASLWIARVPYFTDESVKHIGPGARVVARGKA